MSAGDGRRRPQVLNPAIGAGTDENAVDLQIDDGGLRLQSHVFQSSGRGFPIGGVAETARIGHLAADARHLPGIGSPGDLRFNVGGVKPLHAVVVGARIAHQLLPLLDRRVKILGNERASAEIVERLLVRGDQPAAGTGLDGHVADGHPLFHTQGPDGGAGVFDAIAGSTAGRNLADHPEDEVLGGDARRQPTFNANLQGPRFVLQERLRGQHVFDLAGANTEGQCPKGPMGGRVAVAANDGHSGLSKPKFRSDHVNDALVPIVQIEETYAKLLAVPPQRIDLLPGDFVCNRQTAAGGGHVVVDSGHRPLRTPDLAPSDSQCLKGLRAGHFMDQLQVDIQDRLLAFFGMDDMPVPELFEQVPGVG